jgi:hypothetical protein
MRQSTIVAIGEEDVIILVAFERRVKMDKVNRFVFDIAAEYFQVIAVIQNRFDKPFGSEWFDSELTTELLTINVLCHIAPVVLFKGESPLMFL